MSRHLINNYKSMRLIVFNLFIFFFSLSVNGQKIHLNNFNAKIYIGKYSNFNIFADLSNKGDITCYGKTNINGNLNNFTNIELKGGDAVLKIDSVSTLFEGGIYINDNVFIVNNSLSSALQSINGRIIIEDTSTKGNVYWKAGLEQRVYEFPLSNKNGEDVFVTLSVDTVGIIMDSISKQYLSVNTFSTNTQNLPYPAGVDHILNEDTVPNINYTAKRFWNINTLGFSRSPVLNVSLKYASSEVANTNISENNLKIQQWIGDGWDLAMGNVNTLQRSITMGNYRRAGTLAAVDFFRRLIRIHNIIYAGLVDKLDGSYYRTIDGYVYFKFFEKYNYDKCHFKIFDWKRDIKLSGFIPGTKYGNNYLNINLNNRGLIENEVYILEVTDSKNNKTYLRLMYKQPQNIIIIRNPFIINTHSQSPILDN